MAGWCLKSNFDEFNAIEGLVRNYMSTDYTKFSVNGNSPKTFAIKDVIFNPPATIVLWKDGTKTVVKCQEDKDEYSKEIGLAMCICKKVYGNKGNYNNIFKKFIKEY